MTDLGIAIRDLAAYLTGSEAEELADRVGAGETLSQALIVISSVRRNKVRQMLTEAGLGPKDQELTVAVLRAVEGAHQHATAITPVWTTPGTRTQHGELTGSVRRLVAGARESIICSTYNFQKSSILWTALREAADHVGVRVRVYVDTDVADQEPQPWKPTTGEIASELSPAIVFRTKKDSRGVRPRNHAKFIAIDHRFLFVTSANFSKSAEQMNIELGLRIDDPILTQGIEKQMRMLETDLYEPVLQ